MPLQPFMVHIQGSEREKEKKISTRCMYVWVCRCTRNSSNNSGGKIFSLYHKVAFFMYERAVFWNYGRAMGITFLGKSEHMRYINFGKFYIEETKKILKSFQTRFSSLKRKRKMVFFCGRGKLSKIVEDRFF